MKLNKKPKHIVILTGAGISAESGIMTFRDSNGLWENHSVYEVASPDGFQRDPELVHRFYNLRRQQLLSGEVHPNPAHLALSKLQEKFNGIVTIITQNVDDLHERSGSRNVIHMHGELLKMRCIETGRSLTIKKDIHATTPCPCCLKEGNLRPHIVWFGERPMHMDKIDTELHSCDLFVAIGTSGHVYPAAMFVDTARERGVQTIEINLESTQISDSFDFHLVGNASVETEKFVEELLT
ncbi:Sir2 family NAD+-dependent deacetylase [Bacteriovorax sp. Seq25_V]|uniref:Sir2 family NAD+-dependent deacetylase n=1 Tax=Bacteriovorax sp. Seq25_V TaxID=1201288 RepID=UPI00038A3EC7|nr:Sir2 family NAD+-dependent deacetylase [Bacteriovorax sp. Seq25_V]EQC43880.1 transcriptional regulator, Sir2 family [Bacteriovorax sp. Seq25_V]